MCVHVCVTNLCTCSTMWHISFTWSLSFHSSWRSCAVCRTYWNSGPNHTWISHQQNEKGQNIPRTLAAVGERVLLQSLIFIRYFCLKISLHTYRVSSSRSSFSASCTSCSSSSSVDIARLRRAFKGIKSVDWNRLKIFCHSEEKCTYSWFW